jgi:colanic acid biosynthesis glycosyl transferase WcaI
MRILVWSPNYAPELIGIPPLVTQFAESMVAQQHEVVVVTPFPNYPARVIYERYRGMRSCNETIRGVRVSRHWIRVRPRERVHDKILYELSFALVSFPAALRYARNADVVVTLVPSLLSAAIAASAFRRARLVVWWQDLIVNASAAVADGRGVMRAAQRVGRTLEAGVARRADLNVVCSPGFEAYLRELVGEPAAIQFVPNWVDTERIVPTPEPVGASTRFLYAGNVGYSQGFDTLFEAARRAPKDIEIEIVGDGNAAPLVRERARTNGVTYRMSVPEDEYPRLLQDAHVHVVIQRGISGGANLPSKIGSYLASGRPVVASLALDCPAADLLRASGGAIVVPPDDPVALSEALARLHGDRDLRRRLALSGRRYAEQHLARSTILPALSGLILGADS